MHLERIDFVHTESVVFADETAIRLMKGKAEFGHFGQIRESLIEAWDIKNPVFAFEIDLSVLAGQVTNERHYLTISRFPAVKRDLALVVDESVLAEQVLDLIRQTKTDYLKSVDLFDIYRGDSIESGKKNMAFSLTFSSPDRTLQDKDIEPVMTGIIQNLQKKIDASLRT